MAEKQEGGRESFFLRINTRGKGGHIIIYMRARERADPKEEKRKIERKKVKKSASSGTMMSFN